MAELENEWPPNTACALPPVAEVHWRDTLTAIGLGAANVIIQLVFFNDATMAVMK